MSGSDTADESSKVSKEAEASDAEPKFDEEDKSAGEEVEQESEGDKIVAKVQDKEEGSINEKEALTKLVKKKKKKRDDAGSRRGRRGGKGGRGGGSGRSKQAKKNPSGMTLKLENSNEHTRRDGDRYVEVTGGSCKLEQGVRFRNNVVITSRYRWWNFPFLNLYEQFSNLANVYFLIIGVIQLIPETTTTNGLPTMYQPLLFIIFVSALRAAREDYNKHKADAARNGYKYRVLRDGKLEDVSSGQLNVGDIVQIRKNDMIPADLIFLGSSLEKGHCFIDKANLNGETKLEVLSSLTATRDACLDIDVLQNLHIRLTYEPPNSSFDSFRGEMTVNDPVTKETTTFGVDGKTLMMRETNLRNVEYIFALVVYTGGDTKIQMSNSESGKARLKKSRIMRRVDRYLLMMLFVQTCMCIFAACWSGLWLEKNRKSMDYLQFSTDGSVASVAIFACFSWYILLSNMVPISLIVSAEMVKFAQAWFINQDLTLYYAPINKKAKCNNSTIHEDLGLIDYVFSDKTGTLTQNRMEFRYALMRKSEDAEEKKSEEMQVQEYGTTETEIAKSVQKRNAELAAKEKRATNSDDDDDGIEDKGDSAAAGLLWTQLSLPLHSKRLVLENPEEKMRKENNANRKRSLKRQNTIRRSYVAETMKDTLDREQQEQEYHKSRRCHWFLNTCWEKRLKDKLIERSLDSNVEKKAVTENCFTEEEAKNLRQSLWGCKESSETEEECASRKKELRNYMIHMALSNTVKPYDDEGVLKFQSESAEEDAMCKFARKLGFLKKSQNPTVLEITELEEDLKTTKIVQEKYLHLATFGFTSKRARVTLIYERVSDGKLVVMTKGQDTVILPLLKDCPNQEKLMAKLENLCSNGLRTLVCAEAILPIEWWTKSRANEYKEIITADESPKTAKRMHTLFERMEKDAGLSYMGCMGLEDQLQLLVPESIADYLRAGIRVWMITGDKLETAKNIGIACNLIDPDMSPSFKAGQSIEDAVKATQNARLLEITGHWSKLKSNEEEMEALFSSFDADNSGFIQAKEMQICLQALNFSVTSSAMDKAVVADERGLSKKEFFKLMNSFNITMFQAVKSDIEHALQVVHSIENHDKFPVSVLLNRDAFHCMYPNKTMRGELRDGEGKVVDDEQLESLREKFFLLASVSKSVVFARAEPAMKKKMVTEVMARNPGVTTLAIGDGANDTDMIQAAHIGVGIAGIEGTAATNASDYAVGTFRMLHTLIFVHGHWNYIRISKLVCYIFYKAVMMAMCNYNFGPDSAFSGAQYFNDPPVQMYNIFFTSLPVIMLAVFDKPLNRRTLENNPFAFKALRGTAFTLPIFAGFLFRAFWHALVLYTVITSMVTEEYGWLYTSTMVMIGCVCVATLTIIFDMKSFAFPHALSIFLSFGAVFFLTWFINIFPAFNSELYFVVNHIWTNPNLTILPLLLAICIPILAELGWRGISIHLRPSFNDVLQERVKVERAKKKSAVRVYANKTSALKHKRKVVTANNLELNELRQQHRPVEIAVPRSDELKWERRKPKKQATESANDNLKKIQALVGDLDDGLGEQENAQHHEKLRKAVLMSMLRFRNRAAAFDSAAKAGYEVHDNAVDIDAKGGDGTVVGQEAEASTEQGETVDGFVFTE